MFVSSWTPCTLLPRNSGENSAGACVTAVCILGEMKGNWVLEMQSRIQHVWEQEGCGGGLASSEWWKYWEKDLIFVLCNALQILKCFDTVQENLSYFWNSNIFIDQKCIYLAFWWTGLFFSPEFTVWKCERTVRIVWVSLTNSWSSLLKTTSGKSNKSLKRWRGR